VKPTRFFSGVKIHHSTRCADDDDHNKRLARHFVHVIFHGRFAAAVAGRIGEVTCRTGKCPGARVRTVPANDGATGMAMADLLYLLFVALE
jgi:hypothetical protein